MDNCDSSARWLMHDGYPLKNMTGRQLFSMSDLCRTEDVRSSCFR